MGVFAKLLSKMRTFFGGAYFFDEIKDSTVGENKNGHLKFTVKNKKILSVRLDQNKKKKPPKNEFDPNTFTNSYSVPKYHLRGFT